MNPCTHVTGGWGGVRETQDVSWNRKSPSSRGIRHPECPARSLAINWLNTERFAKRSINKSTRFQRSENYFSFLSAWLSLPKAMKSSYSLVTFFEAWKTWLVKNVFGIMGPFEGRVLYKRSREKEIIRKFCILLFYVYVTWRKTSITQFNGCKTRRRSLNIRRTAAAIFGSRCMCNVTNAALDIHPVMAISALQQCIYSNLSVTCNCLIRNPLSEANDPPRSPDGTVHNASNIALERQLKKSLRYGYGDHNGTDIPPRKHLYWLLIFTS